jgi:hypothetical protein
LPKGGDLSATPDGAAPRLLIHALRDPDGANLERIQVVEGWTSGEGSQEHVYDVSGSRDRTPDADGKLSPVGDTVDPDTATYSNAIDAPYLDAFWDDPDFDPEQRAFYDLRVIEIPTLRWTTYDAVFFGIDRPQDQPASQQERAHTSPNWYTPAG